MSPTGPEVNPWLRTRRPVRRAQVRVEHTDGSWSLTTAVALEGALHVEHGQVGQRHLLRFDLERVEDYRVLSGRDLAELPAAERAADEWSEAVLGGAPEPPLTDQWVDVHGPWPASLAEQVRFLFPGQPLATVMPAEAWVPQINAGSVVIAGVEWQPAVVRWQASTRTLEVVLEQPEDPTPDPEPFPARHPDGPDPARVEHVRMWLDPADGWPERLGWPVVVSAGTEGFEGLARLWTGSTGQRSGHPFRVTRAGWDGVTRYLDLHLEPEASVSPDPDPVEASRGVESLRMALQQALADHATAASTGPVFGTMAVGFRPQTLSVPEVRYLLSLLPPPPLPTEPGTVIRITQVDRNLLTSPLLAFRVADDTNPSSRTVWIDADGGWWHDQDITGWQPAGGD